jgi:sterol 3beta-glucosyltransferase
MRILLTTIGTTGDMVPFARLAEALAARGHQVTVHSYGFYRGAFAATGARFVEAASGHTAAGLGLALAEGLTMPTPMDQVARFARFFYYEHGAEFLAGCRAAMIGQDLAVCNVIDHLGQEAAELAGVRWLGWASRPPPTGVGRGHEDRLLEPTDLELTRHIRSLGGTRQKLRIFRTPSPTGNLVGASPALCALGDDLDAPYFITGPLLLPADAAPVPEAVSKFLAEGPKAVLVSFGSLPDAGGWRLGIVLEAIRRVGCRAVVQGTGPAADGVLYAGALSYPSVLPRVAGIVHHGGAGTTHEAARAGVPQLLIPHMADQPYWAQRVAALGIGPTPIRHFHLDAEGLAEGLAELGDPALRERAAAVAAAMRSDAGTEESVRRIESAAVAT